MTQSVQQISVINLVSQRTALLWWSDEKLAFSFRRGTELLPKFIWKLSPQIHIAVVVGSKFKWDEAQVRQKGRWVAGGLDKLNTSVMLLYFQTTFLLRVVQFYLNLASEVCIFLAVDWMKKTSLLPYNQARIVLCCAYVCYSWNPFKLEKGKRRRASCLVSFSLKWKSWIRNSKQDLVEFNQLYLEDWKSTNFHRCS